MVGTSGTLTGMLVSKGARKVLESWLTPDLFPIEPGRKYRYRWPETKMFYPHVCTEDMHIAWRYISNISLSKKIFSLKWNKKFAKALVCLNYTVMIFVLCTHQPEVWVLLADSMKYMGRWPQIHCTGNIVQESAELCIDQAQQSIEEATYSPGGVCVGSVYLCISSLHIYISFARFK